MAREMTDTGIPSEEELIDYISKVDDYRAGIAPEDTTNLTKIAKAEEEAGRLYRQKADRAEWASLFEQLGRSLTRYGAATQGLKAGVDVSSNLRLDEPTDYDKRTSGYLEEYKTELGLQGRLRDALGKKQELSQKRLDVQAGREEKRMDLSAKLSEGKKDRASKEKIAGMQAAASTARGDVLGLQQTSYISDTNQPVMIDKANRQHVLLTANGPIPYSGPMILRTDQSIEGRGTSASIGDIALSREQKKSIDEARTTYDTQTKISREKGIQTELASDIVDRAVAGNGSALTASGSFIATMIQDGRLSDKDVTMYMSQPALIDKMRQHWAALRNGNIPEDLAANIKEVLELAALANEKYIYNRAQTAASRFLSSYNKDKKFNEAAVVQSIDPTVKYFPTNAEIIAARKEHPKLSTRQIVDGYRMKEGRTSK